MAAEHLPLSRHSYGVVFVQPGPGLHRQSGRPGARLSVACTRRTRCSVRCGISLMLMEVFSWMGSPFKKLISSHWHLLGSQTAWW